MSPNPVNRALLRAVQLSSNLATLAACRLVRWTGKSREAVHPKHLVAEPAVGWYVDLVRSGDCILDLGAGTAIHGARCAAAGAALVVAAELSERNLAKARGLASGGKVRLVRCDATRPLPFRDGVFTGALLLDILEHLAGPETALREVVRTLRPGGWVAVALPNSQTKWKQRYRRAGLPWMSDRDHKQEYTWPQIADLLKTAGLRIESGPAPIIFDTPLAGWIDLIGGLSLRLYRRGIAWRIRRAEEHPQESTGFRCVAMKP
ncbi:MAG: methyltransferase domain-containing protein [Candidatus Sumerlaeia bacterium]|nr:methyltransferase domain-containing protein [Candidatus Sumerlaeia bacterium]